MEIEFKRSGIISGYLNLQKNLFILTKIKMTSGILIWGSIMIALIIFLILETGQPLINFAVFLFIAAVAVGCHIAFSLPFYILRRFLFRNNELKAISLEDSQAIFKYSNINLKISYENIEEISLACGNRYFYSFFYSSAMSDIIATKLNYYIKLKNTDDQKDKTYVPLDLPGIKEFLKILIEKSGLAKNTSSFSLSNKWKRLEDSKENNISDDEIRMGVINPNKDLYDRKYDKIILLILVGGLLALTAYLYIAVWLRG